MTIIVSRLALSVSIVLLGACGSNSSTGLPGTSPLHAGTDLPSQFEPPAGYERPSPSDTIPGDGCLSPMRDPRDDTEIRMVRSAHGKADYTVPKGRYGVGPHQLLRLDCNTGRPLRVVKE
jgi:hypothetical protein